ncbi:hypothetical protein R3W88_022384 [Solanum pinnatisectum]|uniref:Uncharacterized protein n=1 Tax=Solanum pinnatisectum TaxID=50273 RepID=A0AAV9LUJ4_9SOLN|nr:hypothetical protein R3W88_022384 [Solanum pinnatisectum]
MIPWHHISGQPVTEPDEVAKLFGCPLPPQKLKPGSCCHEKDERLLSYQAMGMNLQREISCIPMKPFETI